MPDTPINPDEFEDINVPEYMKRITILARHSPLDGLDVKLKRITFIQKGEYRPSVAVKAVMFQCHTPKPHIYIK